ncbi:MAG: polyvinylalcohol dehydrogenase, partial [Planctomycetota bacterium]
MMRALLLLLACGGPVFADEWPQWLGPARNGVSTESVPAWKEAPKVAWKLPVGEGHSSPIVADGRAYLHAKVQGQDGEEVIACNARTGEIVWRQAYPRAPFKSAFGHGPRAT